MSAFDPEATLEPFCENDLTTSFAVV